MVKGVKYWRVRVCVNQWGYDERRSCKQYVPVLEHCCFIQKVKTPEEEDPLHVLFDHEAMQTHGQHEANLLIAEREDSETQNGV